MEAALNSGEFIPVAGVRSKQGPLLALSNISNLQEFSVT
jgi:hypothetical protein